jgi:hypothetical protein
VVRGGRYGHFFPPLLLAWYFDGSAGARWFNGNDCAAVLRVVSRGWWWRGTVVADGWMVSPGLQAERRPSVCEGPAFGGCRLHVVVDRTRCDGSFVAGSP